MEKIHVLFDTRAFLYGFKQNVYEFYKRKLVAEFGWLLGNGANVERVQSAQFFVDAQLSVTWNEYYEQMSTSDF